MEKIFSALETAISNASNTIRTMWRNANNASRIRRANRGPSVRQRLSDTLICMIISFGFMLFCCIGFYSVDSVSDKIASLLMGAVFLGIMAWLHGYRNAIADSRTARIRYEEHTRQTCQRIERNIRHIIRRLVVFVLIVLVTSVALQYVPNLEKHVPMVADAADLIVDTFNNLIAQAVAFIQSHIA